MVDKYRRKHAQLSSKGWYRDLSKNHTPLFNEMKTGLEQLGFDSLQKFWNASKQKELNDTGIAQENPRKDRLDLAILGEAKELNGVSVQGRENEMELVIDGKSVMTTSLLEHLSMARDVKECPDNARCFIAGLGLGLILLYLAKTGKSKEVVVCEIDKRVIDLLAAPIKQWLMERNPNFNLQILHADAFDKIPELGAFDWVYFDTSTMESEELFKQKAQTVLTKIGKYTAFHPYKLLWQ